MKPTMFETRRGTNESNQALASNSGYDNWLDRCRVADIDTSIAPIILSTVFVDTSDVGYLKEIRQNHQSRS